MDSGHLKKMREKLAVARQRWRGVREIATKSRRFISKSHMTDDPRTRSQAERDAMVEAHIIEKGLCHQEFRPRFGAQYVERLRRFVEGAGSGNEFAVRIGADCLLAYSERNKQAGVDVTDLAGTNVSVSHSCLLGGVDLVKFEDLFPSGEVSFPEFAASRRSTRLFDEQSAPLSRGQLSELVAIAQTAPSACNRQAHHVYAVTDSGLIEGIAALQGGARGFAENAGALLVVTANCGFYTATEFSLPWYDAGMFGMNLLYAAHSLKMGACPLNPSLAPWAEEQILSAVRAAPEEALAGLFLLSVPRRDSQIAYARAPRRPLEDVLSFVDPERQQ